MRRPEGCAVVVVRPGPLRTRLERRPAAEEVARVVGGEGDSDEGVARAVELRYVPSLLLEPIALPCRCWPSLPTGMRKKSAGCHWQRLGCYASALGLPIPPSAYLRGKLY